MRKLTMFVTAVCVLFFIIKLPQNFCQSNTIERSEIKLFNSNQTKWNFGNGSFDNCTQNKFHLVLNKARG